MARSESLGDPRSVSLRDGTIDYRERGAGPPVLFVHGVLVNGDLWRAVVPIVAGAGYRCLVPDWPLGSHQRPMAPTADLSPPGVAALIDEFLAALDLTDVTIVANDTGGALVQILLARRPERVGRVVLTPCDGLDWFFPPLFRFLSVSARLPGSVWLLVQALRLRAVRQLPLAFGWLTKRPIPPEVFDSYLAPAQRSAGVRRDLRRFLSGVHRRHTLAAAREFGGFTRPVLLAWAAEDRIFPVSLARRLAELLPDARLSLLADCRTFVPEDQPAALGALIVDFVRSTMARSTMARSTMAPSTMAPSTMDRSTMAPPAAAPATASSIVDGERAGPEPDAGG
jgi:pimeloyl-ACP methyl ester carboxylesterase